MPTKSKARQSDEEISALIAVSGGLDSICLAYGLLTALDDRKSKPNQNYSKVDLLLKDFVRSHNLSRLELAYIDHSQRDDTARDIEAVKKIEQKFPSQTKLHIAKLSLPKSSSEETLRKARYEELNKIMSDNKLGRLITAHHSDDVIETAVINLRRGTGPKGLSSLSHHSDGIWRPFLSKLNNSKYITKDDLKEYASKNNLTWHEDTTNQSPNYLRNRIRKKIHSNLSESKKSQLLQIISSSKRVCSEIDHLTKEVINSILSLDSDLENCFIRSDFILLEEDLQKHIVHSLISQFGFDVNRESVNRAVEFIKTAKTKKTLQLKGCHIYIPHKDQFQIYSVSRQS